jgi:hypothetical protein
VAIGGGRRLSIHGVAAAATMCGSGTNREWEEGSGEIGPTCRRSRLLVGLGQNLFIRSKSRGEKGCDLSWDVK